MDAGGLVSYGPNWTALFWRGADWSADVATRTPSGRWGKPDDLIGATVFLASHASDYVNGQIIYVDGGLLAVI